MRMSERLKSVWEPERCLDHAPRVLYPKTYGAIPMSRLNTSPPLAKSHGVKARPGVYGSPTDTDGSSSANKFSSEGKPFHSGGLREEEPEAQEWCGAVDCRAACCNDAQLFEKTEQSSFFAT